MRRIKLDHNECDGGAAVLYIRRDTKLYRLFF